MTSEVRPFRGGEDDPFQVKTIAPQRCALGWLKSRPNERRGLRR